MMYREKLMLARCANVLDEFHAMQTSCASESAEKKTVSEKKNLTSCRRSAFDSTNFVERRIHPIADKLGITRRLVTFQVMCRTVGTDLQFHGTLKDAQGVLRHKRIKTTGNVYMQSVPEKA